MSSHYQLPGSLLRLAGFLVVSILAAAGMSCSGGRQPLQVQDAGTSATAYPQAGSDGWPQGIPQDSRQPWEDLDENGHVVPQDRGIRAINGDSEFVPGVERFSAAANVSDNGEASRLLSESGKTSHAMYRIALGGSEAGVVSVDANLISGKGYYVGLADYGSARWRWHGPFTDNHVRLAASGGDMSSALGNLFVCVLIHGAATCDVVGIGMNPLDGADSTAPASPAAPTLTPAASGLLLEWPPVADADLAGYRIYHSDSSFSDPGAGVASVPYIEGSTQHLLAGLSAATFVRISAVDFSGNESALSAEASDTPLAEGTEPAGLAVSAPSGRLGDLLELTATGSTTNDFDTDGDGSYDITGNTSGTAALDTASPGIIRPSLRSYDAGGTLQSVRGVSVIITSNSRPVADATGTPTSGLAPLDVAFSGSASVDFDGSIVGGGWDFDNDGIYDVWDDTDIVHVTAAGHVYAVPGVYNARLRVLDNLGAWDVDTVSVLVDAGPANTQPVAVLRGSQFTGLDLLEVEFSAIDSYDPDGSIVDYEWDFDGDGVFNEAGNEQDSHGEALPAVQQYTAGLPLVVQLRVTDNQAAMHTANFTLFVHGWVSQALVTAGDNGWNNSLAVVAGNPAISYLDNTNGDLVYVRAVDEFGSAWGSPLAIDTAGNVGSHNSLAVVDGSPAISYYDQTNFELKYVRALDASGASWDSPVTLDSDGDVGGFTSLLVVGGNPAVSYYDFGNFDLKYVRALDTGGGSWAGPITVDTVGDVGRATSMAIVDGKPAISYSGNAALKYVRALDALGGSWDSALQLDTAGTPGTYKTLRVVDGKPAICYQDLTSTDLEYLRALDATGASWDAPVSVDTAGNVGSYCSMAVVSGRPAISYYDTTNAILKYVHALDASGSGWGVPQTADSSGNVGWQTSLVLVSGKPAVSHYDAGNADLRFSLLY